MLYQYFQFFCKGTPIGLVLLTQLNMTQLVGKWSDDKFPQEHRETSPLGKQSSLPPWKLVEISTSTEI